MRVALHVDGPRIRGNERQAILLADRLTARGHEVLVSCRSGGPVARAVAEAGARATGVRPRGDADIVSATLFGAWLRRERVDAVLVTSWKRAAIAGAAARLGGVDRVVLRLGGLRGRESGVGSRVRRFALRRVYDAVVANSGEVRDQLVERFGVPSPRVRLIRNGISLPDAANPAALRGELGIPADAPLVLTVGGLERNKGADLLPGVLAALPGGTHMAVAGAGPDERVRALVDDALRLGVSGRLHLLGHRSDVPALLAAADAFLLPSRSDSLPNAMLEAMAAGLPVVVTEVGGVREALGPVEGRPPAGWTAPIGDTAAIAAAVEEALREGLHRAADGTLTGRPREAARRAELWFSADRMTDEYERVLSGGEGSV